MKNKTIRLVLLILAPSILLRAFAMDIMLPGIPAVARYFQAEFATSQWILSLFFIGAGIGQLLWGPLADEYGRRKVLIGSTAILVFSSLACANSNDIYWLMFFRLIQGLAAAGTTDATMAIIRDLYDDKQTAKAYSYLNSIVGLAPLIAPALGGLLLTSSGGWQACFYFMALFSFLALLVNYTSVPETNQRISEKKPFVAIHILQGYKKILTDPQFMKYTFCSVMAFSCLFMFFSSSAILAIEILGVSPANYGNYFALNSVIYIIGNICSPWFQNKVASKGTILYGSLIITIGAACMFILNLLQGLTVLNLMLPNTIVTFGVGLILGPCMAEVMKNYRHIAGMASAVYGAIVYCGSSLLVSVVMQLEIHDASKPAAATFLFGLISFMTIRKLISS